jgi:hypothetical protein
MRVIARLLHAKPLADIASRSLVTLKKHGKFVS